MAIRADASGDDINRSSNILNMNAAYTVAGWVYVVSAGGWSWSTFYAVNNASSDADVLQFEENDGSGNTYLAVGQAIGGSWNSSTGATVITPGTWHHVAIVRESTTSLKMYLDGVQQGSTITTSVASRGAATDMRMFRANSSGGDPLSGRIAYVKAWTRGLTIADIAAEMLVIRPLDFVSLYGFWPMFPGATERLLDYSGNGNAWTAAGTLTDEQEPPVSYGAGVYILPYAVTAAASGATAGSAAGIASHTAALRGFIAARGTAAGIASPSAAGRLLMLARGTAAGVASQSGAIKATGRLGGSTAGASTAIATANTPSGAMSGTAAGVASQSAALAGRGALSGSISGVVSHSGIIVGNASISASAQCVSTLIGNLSGSGALAGTAQGTTTGAASLSAVAAGSGAMSGVASGTSIHSGAMSATGALYGLIAATSTQAATISAAGRLIGVASGISAATGFLVDMSFFEHGPREVIEADIRSAAYAERQAIEALAHGYLYTSKRQSINSRD